MTAATPLHETALEIAAEYVESAVATQNGLSWHGPLVSGLDGDQPVIGHGDIGSSLYDGTAGVAMMLAAAATVAARQGLSSSASLTESARRSATGSLQGGWNALGEGRLGLFDGATGVALAAATVGRRLGDPHLLTSAETLSREVTRHLAERALERSAVAEVDLISGAAGVVLGLLGTRTLLADKQRLAREDLRDDELQTLRAVGHWLVDKAEPQTWGSAWRAGGTAAPQTPLLGLGHGAAGICLALAEIALLTGDDDVTRAVHEGLEYERGWYDPDRVAWPDLRRPSGSDPRSGGGAPVSMAAWCHGSIGIGLSRARMLCLDQSSAEASQLRLELSAALQAVRDLVVHAGTVLQSGVPTDCTPCHGLSGSVELLLAAEQALDAREHGRAARGVAALIVEQGARGPWPCGMRGAGQVRGLMTGRAGVAMTLLRADGFRDVPTPLLPGSLAW